MSATALTSTLARVFSLAGVAMKVIIAVIIAVSVLYVMDQQFAHGHYTDAAAQMIGQIRHSMGM